MKYLISVLLLLCLWGSSGCGSVFGGEISECQRSAPRHGEPKRQIRPAVFASDAILGLYLLEIPLAVDFIDGAMYKPCIIKPIDTLALKRIDDSLHKRDSVRENSPFQHSLSVSTDVMQYSTIQPNLSIEYAWDHNAVGFYTGLILPSSTFAVNPFAKGQYTDPGTVYNGWAFKFYYKYYDKKWPNHYWCVQLEYKPEWFNNKYFYDEAIQDEAGISYTMNEKANIYGFDILRGYELVTKTPFHLDIFFGLGLHAHAMNFDVTSLVADYQINKTSNGYPDGNHYIALGNNTLNTLIPTPVVGLKIGLK